MIIARAGPGGLRPRPCPARSCARSTPGRRSPPLVDEGTQVEDRRPAGAPSQGRRGASSPPSGPCSTSSAICPAWPPSRGASRGRWRAPAPWWSTPARPSPGCGCGRSGPWSSAAATTTASACSTWCSSRTTISTAAGGVRAAMDRVKAARRPLHQGRGGGGERSRPARGHRLRGRHHHARQPGPGLARAAGGGGPGASSADVVLEASGGVSLDNVRAVAETGVDLISTSALTMGAPPVDLGLTLSVSS